MITKNDVEHVAFLARIKLSEEEKDIYTRQLSDIIKYMQKLNELDTENIEPTAHVLSLENVFREDKVGEHLNPEKVLLNAPDREGNFFRVPKIV